MGGGDLLQDLVLGTSNKARQAQLAETLSHVSAALSTIVAQREERPLSEAEEGIQVCLYFFFSGAWREIKGGGRTWWKKKKRERFRMHEDLVGLIGQGG